ncbi:hypothetical protein E2C01_010050 [Portunus trituberculatus]|uniref:Uncharacterized protein n=1 Tax=Portunus trituberculatus TaxID=210409 RepID=A0A5B7D7C4_PORTR|nr:hypothetical protein [Portunus trituberculatus]
MARSTRKPPAGSGGTKVLMSGEAEQHVPVCDTDAAESTKFSAGVIYNPGKCERPGSQKWILLINLCLKGRN